MIKYLIPLLLLGFIMSKKPKNSSNNKSIKLSSNEFTVNTNLQKKLEDKSIIQFKIRQPDKSKGFIYNGIAYDTWFLPLYAGTKFILEDFKDIFNKNKYTYLLWIKNNVKEKYKGIVASIIEHESNWINNAELKNTNKTKDIGLGQINETTLNYPYWKLKLSLQDLYDPFKNMALMSEILEVYDKKYGVEGGVASIFRRYGGSDQLLQPQSDYENSLANIAFYADLLKS